MRRYFREVHPDDRAVMVEQIHEWGYPREVTDAEVSRSTFVRHGDDSVAWFEETNDSSVLGLHACASPGARGRAGASRNEIALGIVGELLGAEYLVALIPETLPKGAALRRLLSMRGWIETEHGLTKPLGVD